MTAQKAGFWLRVSALTIDEILLISLTYILLCLINPYVPQDFRHSIWFDLLFYETIDYNYYTLFWVSTGQTLGKKLLKTKLVKADGSRFTYKNAVVRYWTWMVGMASLGLGYFWIAWDENKRGWNDLASKTLVIKV